MIIVFLTVVSIVLMVSVLGVQMKDPPVHPVAAILFVLSGIWIASLVIHIMLRGKCL